MRDTEAPLEPIAVVGLAFRLPGGANDVDGLWRLLETGEPAWTPVPADRFNGEAFYHPSPDDPNGTSNHPGGHFLSSDVDIRAFDHAFFRLSRAQAAALDPQQRLVLELAHEALETAGIPRDRVAGTTASVHAALFPTDYDRHLHRDPLDLPVYHATGTGTALLANRLSHALDLRGASVTLDTACSGGLVALHQACQGLRGGEADTAFVTASNLILGPDQAVGLSNLHMLSSTGRCYPFDSRGEGYGRGEGVVVLVLKRLDDAIRDRDPVRSIIRGSAIGQDGYTPQGITYPNGQAQADLGRAVYTRTGLRPEEVAYVEAHGTGTKAGDEEELKGIAEVFAAGADRQVPLYVGSIKGAIGHTESAAGLASLLKATVMLDRGLIPPVAGFANPKPSLPLDHIQIPTRVVPWPQTAGFIPRISINSFGFGGANAHAILERGQQTRQNSLQNTPSSPRLFTLSANTTASLKAMIRAQHRWIQQQGQQQNQATMLADLSYTLLHRRTPMKYRFSTVAGDHESLLAALDQGLATADAAKPVPAEDPDVVFVFTGQGAQWAGMGRELLLETTSPSSPVFRDSIRASRDVLLGLGAAWDLETELLRDAAVSRLNEAELAQPATTAVQIALVRLLLAQGVRPRAVVGHSSGEVAAAYAAGHLSHEAALKIAFHRGFMTAAVRTKGLGHGAMMSVGLGENDVGKYLHGLQSGKVVVACVNSPRNVTVSGDADAVTEFAGRLDAAGDGTFHRKLLVDAAYHSHHMAAVADEYRASLKGLEVETTSDSRSGTIEFISSVTGQLKTDGFDAEYWIANLVSPVRFADAVQKLVKTRHRAGQHVAFVEVGPHPALLGPVRQNLQHTDMPKVVFNYQAALERKVGAVASALGLAGKLFEHGLRVHWDGVSPLAPGADDAVVRHDLPAYPWDHSTEHWYESRVSKAYRLRTEPYHDLVGMMVPDVTDLEPRWRHFLSRATLPWLADHVVDGLTIFPGAGYVCMAIEAVAQLSRQRFPQRQLETLALHDISFKRGLIVPETGRVELQLSLKPQPGLFIFGFTITAFSDSGDWYEHATGVVEGILAEESGGMIATTEEELPSLPPDSLIVPKSTLYADMDAVGNTYGTAFAGLDGMTLAADASQAASSFDVLDIQASMPAAHQRPHVIHPSTLDIIFHTALPLVGRLLGPGSVMPVHIDELLISATPLLHQPGSKLHVSTLIKSSHFRTAVSDMAVLANSNRVLSIEGMEFRSLALQLQGGSNETEDAGSSGRELCYELDWHVDSDYMRLEDLPENKGLADVLGCLALKRYGLSTIGLGIGVDLTCEVLNAIETDNRNKVVQHDFVDATPGRFEDAAERLKGFTTRLRTLRPGSNPVARGFEAGTCDLVLAASPRWLNQTAVLVKPGGTVILVLGPRDLKDGDDASARGKLLRGTAPPLEEQLMFHDDAQGKLVVVARIAGPQLPAEVPVHILTHSATHDTPAWVEAVARGLRSRHGVTNVSVDTLGGSAAKSLHSGGGVDGTSNSSNNAVVVVVDDQPDQPILSDARTFDAAIALLSQPTRIVWVSPDDPAEFHQIEGVARTAHAENSDLRLTTVHAASGLLDSKGGHKRLMDVVTNAVSELADANIPHTEREYRIHEGGAVVVPRLKHSEKLGRAIAQDGGPRPQERRRFADVQQSLALSPDGSAMYIEDHRGVQAVTTPLADDEIEVAVEAFVLSKRGAAAAVGEYAGSVVRVGANVRTLAPGHHVVALAPVVGANILRIPSAHASQVAPGVRSSTAAALILDTMAASYGLGVVARLLSSGGTVLIHGVRTAAGRAAATIARSIGLRVTVTAADMTEALLVQEQQGIDQNDILVARRSLSRRLPHQVFSGGLDAIVQASEKAVPAEALGHLKPFGSVLAISSTNQHISSATGEMHNPLPPNVGFHHIDISGLVLARPDLTTTLVAQAAAALADIPLSGFEIPVRSVAETTEALRLLNTGIHAKVVLLASPDAEVQVAAPAKVNAWADEDATYIVAGGLGDIGQRFLLQMARLGAKNLATISRSDVDPATRRAMQARLEAIRPNIHLYTLQGDVSSEASVRAAAATLARSGAPPVRGVVQGAVVMNDCPLERTTYAGFRSVTKAKVDGTLALYSAFASPDLEFFLSLSSVASIVGASAEASYNAGNAVQDALAHVTKSQRRAERTHFLTANLGWSEGATLTVNDETRQAALRRAGFSLIRAEELTRFIDYTLGAARDADRDTSQAIIGFDVASLAGATAHNGTIHSAMFSHVRHARHGGGGNERGDGASTATGAQVTFEQVVGGGDAEAVVDFIARATTEQLARLIAVDVDSIDTRQSLLQALGLDSLVAVELRNWAMRQFDAPLQSSEILANQTVQALAEKIAARSKKVVRAAP